MDEWGFAIARSLVKFAKLKRRTHYPEVAADIGWPHDQGRGMGKILDSLLNYCHEKGYPALTTILVKKGTYLPPENAVEQIKAVLGNIDISEAQQTAFNYDWSQVHEFELMDRKLPHGREYWLTSFWGFSPETWGCIGFDDEAKRQKFINSTKSGVLVAIYVTKDRDPGHMGGKLVGIYEVSHQKKHVRQCISGDQWARKQADPESKGKWEFSLKVTRAWYVVEEEWQKIDDVLPNTYSRYDARFQIGAKGVPINQEEIENLLKLTVFEVPVFGGQTEVKLGIQSLSNVMKPSRAIVPSKEPYWVGETDGPKHLYILNLKGNLQTYLGKEKAELEDKMIVKVGFSKSPLTRCQQIQSAYPAGEYNWEVFKPETIPNIPPYLNAEIAIIGENRMKERMIEAGAQSLGREFFLTDIGTVLKVWVAGKMAIDAYMKNGTNQ
jgi:hypothetical protein